MDARAQTAAVAGIRLERAIKGVFADQVESHVEVAREQGHGFDQHHLVLHVAQACDLQEPEP